MSAVEPVLSANLTIRNRWCS